ncbi:DUF2017 family protein [Nakamurella sp. YIM 132087]|uniref:DUF2017 family protein n=1 Tax=Nakamurella alba TaxID=2665158 RepID=A0A7K1FH00_9ACTN|nr:DUF2017 domain-containing protein [Nakamurella alba]MTD13350.1 DUF2017 family protein [Nakamurella alba]
MRPFRRFGGRYRASFEAVEVTVLSDLVDQVRQLLAGRRSEAPDDPLVAMTGIATAPSTTPEDPALARLLPDFHREDPELSAGLRALREPEIIAGKDSAAVAVLDSLPPGGGAVHLDEDQARQWIAALNDVRLALGVRLEITDETDTVMDTAGERPEPEQAMFHTYRWLTYVQDSLVEQMLD